MNGRWVMHVEVAHFDKLSDLIEVDILCDRLSDLNLV